MLRVSAVMGHKMPYRLAGVSSDGNVTNGMEECAWTSELNQIGPRGKAFMLFTEFKAGQ